MKSRLDKLWEFINDYLEVDYGYLPKSHMDDDTCVDEYIQEIKDDFEKMREKRLDKKRIYRKEYQNFKEIG